MKKWISLLLAGLMILSLTACGNSAATPSAGGNNPGGTASADPQGGAPAAGDLTAGVCWYSFSDTFIANARSSLENIANADGTIKVSSADSQGATETQTSNMNNFFTQGVSYLVLNNLNVNATSEICAKADAEGVPLFIVNTTSPSDQDFENFKNLYYISSRAEESGIIMGEALLEYWNAHPEADRNGNGQMDYIMLLGQQGNYDTQMRSGESVRVLQEGGVTMNNIGGDQICDWSRATAMERVSALLANFGNDVDAVIACNDDMALGAIEALKAAGFFGDGEYIPVAGVDATAVGVQALEEGTLLVTALNNPVMLSKAIYKTMWLVANGQEVTTENINQEGVVVEGHRVWLSYTKITADNTADASYDVSDVSF